MIASTFIGTGRWPSGCLFPKQTKDATIGADNGLNGDYGLLLTLRSKMFLGVLSAVSLVILAVTAPSLPLDQWTGLLLLAALCGVAQLLPVRLSHSSSVSVSAGVTFAGLILFGPIAAIWINLGSAIVASFRPAPKPGHKIIFNAGNHVVAAAAAGAIYTAAGGITRPSQIAVVILPVLLAAIGFFLVQTLSISGIIALTERVPLLPIWNTNFLRSGPNFVALAIISLSVASAEISVGAPATFVFSIPLVMGWYVFKHVNDPGASRTDLKSGGNR